MTKFDNNKEAVNLLNNVKGSVENKIRASFNLGYWQGYKEGSFYAVEELKKTFMHMLDTERGESDE